MSLESNIINVKNRINQIKNKDQIVNLILISKKIDINIIEEAINCNIFNDQEIIFGENTIQEAKEKWLILKKKYPKIKLHMVGHLQSNKVKDAVALFDIIEILDSIKLAKILSKEMIKQNKYPEIFIQINIGKEKQKNGIDPEYLGNFLQELKIFPQLNITGLMCIAPKNQNPEKYFQKTYNLAKEFNLKNISMGMSGDFEEAIKYGANFVRIGSAIFNKKLVKTP